MALCKIDEKSMFFKELLSSLEGIDISLSIRHITQIMYSMSNALAYPLSIFSLSSEPTDCSVQNGKTLVCLRGRKILELVTNLP